MARPVDRAHSDPYGDSGGAIGHAQPLEEAMRMVLRGTPELILTGFSNKSLRGLVAGQLGQG